MLTSFFGKSKPAHFLMLGLFMTFGYVWTLFREFSGEFDLTVFFFETFLLGIMILGIILLDFIVSKNHLTRRNAFAIFFYTCFILMFPKVFLHSEIILANIFLLLAIRRIASLRNDSNSEKKILDGALWISVASLFYFWSLLMFVPLWIAVIQKPNATYKQMLIPIVGFFAVFLMNTAFQLLLNDSFSWFFQWKQPIGLDFSEYNSRKVLIPSTLILALLVWTGFYRMRHLSSVPLKEKPNFFMLFLLVAATLAIAVMGPKKDGSEMIFIFAPTAIICTNYLEGIQSDSFRQRDKAELWFKEIILWVVVVFTLLFLFL